MITFGLGGLAILTEGLGNRLAYFGENIPRVPYARVTFVDTTKQTFILDDQTEIKETTPSIEMQETTPTVEIK